MTNRFQSSGNNPSIPKRQENISNRGQMMMHHDPVNTMKAMTLSMLAPQREFSVYLASATLMLQHRTITSGGCHVMEAMKTGADMCSVLGLPRDQEHFECWFMSESDYDVFMFDKDSLCLFANPKFFNWDKLNKLEDELSRRKGRERIDLEAVVKLPKDLSVIAKRIRFSPEAAAVVDEFEKQFPEDYPHFCKYGHFMERDEMLKHCKELGINVDA